MGLFLCFLGFSANRSTAVFMEAEKKVIIHMEVGDSREVERKSPRMEKLLIERGLSYLVFHSPVVVWEVISDASKTVISILSNYQNISSFFLFHIKLHVLVDVCLRFNVLCIKFYVID